MIALLLVVALAEEPEEAAAAALRAFDAGDSAALQAIAEGRDPDPWMVADALCAFGRADAARALVARNPGGDRESLAAYVERFAEPAAEREARTGTLALVREEDDVRVAAATESLGTPRTVLDLRLRSRRGQALMQLGRREDAISCVREALGCAARLGWAAYRQGATLRLGYVLLQMGELDPGLAFVEEAAELARSRGDEEGLARILLVGGSGAAALDPARAQDLLEESARIHRSLGRLSLEAQALEVIGVHRLQRDELDAAAEALERASAAYREAGEPLLALRSLDALARKLLAAERFEEAERIASESIARLPAGEGAALRADFLDVRAGAALGRCDWAAAARFHGESAAAHREAGNPPGEIRATLGRAAGLRHLGELQAASEACDVARSRLDLLPDGADRRELSGDLAGVLLDLGRPNDAVPFFAVARDAALAPAEHPSLEALNLRLAAELQTALVKAELEAGRRADALSSARWLMSLVRSADDPALSAGAYKVMGECLWASGARADALEASERAVADARRSGDRRRIAASLAQLGGFRLALHDLAHAAERLTEAVRIYRELADPLLLSRPLSRLAVCVAGLGRSEEAFALLEESAVAARSGCWSVLESEALNSRGNLLHRLGREREAGEQYRRVLELARGTSDRKSEVAALGNLALTFLALGERDRAAALAGEALRIAEEAVPDLVGRAANIAAAVEWRCGRTAEAIGLFRRSVDLILTPLDRLGEEEGALARSEEFRPVRGGLEASIEAGDSEAAFHFVEAGSARGLLVALGGRDALREQVVPREIRDLESAALERRARASAGVDRALETGNRNEMKHWRAEVRAAEAELAGILERMQRDARRNAQIYCPSPPALEEVRRWLRPGDALVVVGEGREAHHALVVTGGETRFAVLRIAPGGPPDPIEAATPALAEPLRLGGADVTRVLLSSVPPALARVPWCLALPGKEVVYLPSATIWGVLRAQSPEKGTGILAFGDPEAGGGLSRLPAAGEEAREIGTRVFLGADATEEAFRSALGTHWRAIHFACHGAIREDQPLFSALALTPKGPDDGRLAAGEVFGAQVRTDLVTLSACETARGRDYRGEGVLGLTRAFLFAGAPRVIVSLWKVDDAATRALMTTFYGLWRPGALSAAAALRRAQQSVASQERWKDPRFWAAWQLWGLPD